MGLGRILSAGRATADALLARQIVESFEVEVGPRLRTYRDLLDTGVLKQVKSVGGVGGEIIGGNQKAVERVPGSRPAEGETRDETSRMLDGGVYGVNVMASTGSGTLRKHGTTTDYRFAGAEGAEGDVKMPLAKEILGRLRDNYRGRAWCRRYLERLGVAAGLDAPLKHLADAKVVQEFPQMWDTDRSHIAQYEHAVICGRKREVLSQCNEWGEEPTVREREGDVFDPREDMELLDGRDPREWK